jgi:peptidoglycan hydrolase-like protein with peptidoglycan-binding domain
VHSDKVRGRRPARAGGRSAAIAEDHGGFFATIADRTFENPAMSGGVVVMALTAAAIVSNAMFLQNIRHPDPLFATRSATVERAAPSPVPVPLPRSRAEHVPKSEPAAAPETPAPVAEVAPDRALVRDVQEALARRHLYDGTIDGKMGAMTRAAIEAFERDAGMDRTGTPSAKLLAQLRAPVPPPAPARPVARVETVKPPAEAPKPVVEAVKPVVEAAKPVPPEAIPADLSRYRRVQDALNDIGYGPVKVDGHPGEETANAIRRFELDNGLPLTGSPTDRVIARLMKIGALPPDR